MDCLNDEPEFEQYELGDDLIGVVYDGGQQCQMVVRNKFNYTAWCPEQSAILGIHGNIFFINKYLKQYTVKWDNKGLKCLYNSLFSDNHQQKNVSR